MILSPPLPFTAFVLAGGLGTRLRSVVADRPKPMAPVNGTPFLGILIRSLADKGVRNFVLLTGYLGEVIEDYFAGWSDEGLSISCSREQEPLGTGGPVRRAGAHATDPTLLVNGDTFFDADLDALYQFHAHRDVSVTLSLYRVPDAGRYGSVAVDDEGFVTEFHEKDPQAIGPGLINAGLSLLSADFIHSLPENAAFSLEREVFPTLLGSRKIAGLFQDRAFFDIGTPESYRAFETFAKSRSPIRPPR